MQRGMIHQQATVLADLVILLTKKCPINKGKDILQYMKGGQNPWSKYFHHSRQIPLNVAAENESKSL